MSVYTITISAPLMMDPNPAKRKILLFMLSAAGGGDFKGTVTSRDVEPRRLPAGDKIDARISEGYPWQSRDLSVLSS
jgi:hypothetical protein